MLERLVQLDVRAVRALVAEVLFEGAHALMSLSKLVEPPREEREPIRPPPPDDGAVPAQYPFTEEALAMLAEDESSTEPAVKPEPLHGSVAQRYARSRRSF
jgi:hypothetical protein